MFYIIDLAVNFEQSLQTFSAEATFGACAACGACAVCADDEEARSPPRCPMCSFCRRKKVFFHHQTSPEEICCTM